MTGGRAAAVGLVLLLVAPALIALALDACAIGPVEEGGEGGEGGGGGAPNGDGTACEAYCDRLEAASCATENGPCESDCEQSLAAAAGLGGSCFASAQEYVACVGTGSPSGMLCDAPARTLACRAAADRYYSYCVLRTPPATPCSRSAASDAACAGAAAYLCYAEPGAGCVLGGGVRDSYLYCCAGG